MRLNNNNLFLLRLINLKQKTISLDFHRFHCDIYVFEVHELISCLNDYLVDAFEAGDFHYLLFVSVVE